MGGHGGGPRGTCLVRDSRVKGRAEKSNLENIQTDLLSKQIVRPRNGDGGVSVGRTQRDICYTIRSPLISDSRSFRRRRRLRRRTSGPRNNNYYE